MVKLNNSNWLFKVKKSLFLLPILVTLGFLNNPIASSKTEDLPKVQEINIRMAENVPAVWETIEAESEAPTSLAIPDPQPEEIFATNSGYALKVETINLSIPLSKTTLGKNKELLVPEDPNVAAWYRLGPVPGEAGTALITGHLDSPAGPGVFFNLRNLKADEIIKVRRDDGKVATFRIEKLESYAQDDTFPWHLVYATSGEAELRIITCDGVYDPITQRYSRNLVVYASLVSIS